MQFLFSILFFSSFSFANTYEVNLNKADTWHFFGAMKNFTQKIEPIDENKQRRVYTYSTMNSAFLLECEALFHSTYGRISDTVACRAVFDFKKSDEKETIIDYGALGGSIYAQINNESDGFKLYQSFNSFKSTQEEVKFRLPNGGFQTSPMLSFKCDKTGSFQAHCTVIAIPRSH